MVSWGHNGRPVKGKSHIPKIKKKTHIEILNKNDIMDMNMEINILGRLLSNNNYPIANVEIKVKDNDNLIGSLKTSFRGYFIFYGGYGGKYHNFVFSFRGNDKFESCDKSLILI